jgi:hypothetical protein
VDLFLHIGTEKTGTTSVQKFFRANRELLKRNGILYPTAPGNQNHTGLAASAQDAERRGPLRKSLGLKNEADVRRFRTEMMAGLTAELTERPYKTAFMSGEHCSSRLLDDSEVQWLKDQLSPFFDKMHIVVYIRRQDDYLLSTYSTSVKSGATAPLSFPPERAIEQRYDHWDMLQRWARVFGRDKVVCRKFERAMLKSGDIVDDVIDIVGIDPALGFERPEDVNEALDAETLEFLRLFNKFVPRFEGKDLNPSRDNIVPLLSRVSRGPLVTLGEDELDRFMGLFKESNAKVANEYFGGPIAGSDNALFKPRSDKRERTREAVLTAERAVELCAWLWQEKQAQVDRIAERAKRNKVAASEARRKRRRGADADEGRRDANDYE